MDSLGKLLKRKRDEEDRLRRRDPAKNIIMGRDGLGGNTEIKHYHIQQGDNITIVEEGDTITINGDPGVVWPDCMDVIDTATHEGIAVYDDPPTNSSMVALIGKKNTFNSVYLEDSQADFEPGELENVEATASGLELPTGTDGYGWDNHGAFTSSVNYSSSSVSAGWRFKALDNITVIGLRNQGINLNDTYKLNLYDTTDSSMVGTCNVQTTSVGTWEETLFATPITLVKDREYVVTTGRGTPTGGNNHRAINNPAANTFNDDVIQYIGGRLGTTANVMPTSTTTWGCAVDIVIGGGFPHGNRIAPPVCLTALATDPGLEIRWDSTEPVGTDIMVETACKEYMGEILIGPDVIGVGDGAEDTFWLDIYPAERHADLVIEVDGTPTSEYTRPNDRREIIFNAGHEPGVGLDVEATYTGVAEPDETAEVQSLDLADPTGGTYELGIAGNMVELQWNDDDHQIGSTLAAVFGDDLESVVQQLDDTFRITFSVRARASGLVADFTNLLSVGAPDLDEIIPYNSGDWAEQTTATAIGNIPAGSLVGCHLWIRQTLRTDDPAETPVLEELEVYYGSEEYGVFTTGGTVGTL
jgi:hypothetical protein